MNGPGEEARAARDAGIGLAEPAHRRAWGSVFQRAARVGMIQKAGITESRAAHCHLSHVGMWRAL